MAKKQVVKKVLGIVADVIMYIFLALCIFAVFITITSKKDSDGTATIFGYQVRFVQSSSMEKCEFTDVSQFEIKDIPVKSAVFIKTVPEDEKDAEQWYSSLKVGDVLTFKYVYTKQETITHRLVNIQEKETGGYILSLEGDNKNSETGALSQTIDTSDVNSTNYVIGKVTAVSYPIGAVIYALKQPVGLVLIIILPCLIIIVLEVIRIINVVGEDKKKKAKAEKEQQQKEIEDLKRQLSAMQAGAYNNSANSASQEEYVQNSDGETNLNQTQSGDDR